MKVKKTFLALAAALAAAGAQASFVTQHNGVDFTLNEVTSTQFTLRIQGALAATGDWASAQWIDNLAFSWLGFGDFDGTMAPGTWSDSSQWLAGSNCSGLNLTGLCFEATPALALEVDDDMLFTVNLTQGQLALDEAHGPYLQVSFLKNFLGHQLPTHDTLNKHMTWVEPTQTGVIPEPTSVALAGLGLMACGFASRRKRIPLVRQLTA